MGHGICLRFSKQKEGIKMRTSVSSANKRGAGKETAGNSAFSAHACSKNTKCASRGGGCAASRFRIAYDNDSNDTSRHRHIGRHDVRAVDRS